MATTREVILAVFVSYSLVLYVNSLSFTLSAKSKKCLREEVHKDILVTGEYRLSEAPVKTHLTVSSPLPSHRIPPRRLAHVLFIYVQ